MRDVVITRLRDNERTAIRKVGAIKTTPAFPHSSTREHAKSQSSRASATVINQKHFSSREKQLLARSHEDDDDDSDGDDDVSEGVSRYAHALTYACVHVAPREQCAR